MKICHMILLFMLGMSAAAKLTAQELPHATAPLTGKQRLLLFGSDTFASPAAYAGVGFGAMIDQLRHSPAQWDRDGNAYGRRFASEWGQLALRNGIHEGLAGLSGLDPRYARCTCKGVFHRSLHAVAFSVTTYRQEGGLALDLSQLAGAYGSGIVSSYWYPHTQANVLSQGVLFGHEQVGEIAINHLVLEFSEDLQRALHLPRWVARRQDTRDDD